MEQFFATWDLDIEDANKDKNQLYQTLLDKLKEDENNLELIWRLVQACLVLADSYEKVKNKAEAKKLTEESFKYAKRAVELGPNSLPAHKWYCASVGRMAPLVGTKERIRFGHEFKEHRDIAIGIDPDDRLLHHMYGRWCYEVASLSFIERKLASALFSEPPKATYEEALESLLKADNLKHEWKSNQLWLAKAFIALKKYTDAIKWVDLGLGLPVQTEEDAVTEIELKDLEKSYAKYRK